MKSRRSGVRGGDARSASPLLSALRRSYEALRPAPLHLSGRERLRSAVGAVLCLSLTAALSRWLADPLSVLPWLVAPLGATTVLVFAAPASPMAQPWPAVVGNTVSALVGVACARFIGDPVLAAGAAASLAISAMFLLRCMHPPGGAVALTAVLLQVKTFQFALFPVFGNTLLLVLLGMAWHRAGGRRYPHSQQPAAPKAGEIGSRFSRADIEAALAQHDEVLDVSRDDLEALLKKTELNAYRRLFGELRCADIMSRQLHAVPFGAALAEAWSLMRRHEIKALPVVDHAGRIVGIVTRADFLREANLDVADGIGERIRTLVRKAGTLTSSKPDVVGQIMTRRVRVARQDRHVLDLLAAFSEDGHHHLPVVDADDRVIGMVTLSDVVRALAQRFPPIP